jgi:hypothetical protein
VQIRKAVGERLAAAPAGGGATGFEILSTVFRAAASSDALSSSPSVQPSPTLTHLVILLFQCARSSSASVSGGFVEQCAKDTELLVGLVHLLGGLTTGKMDQHDTSERTRTAGRVCFLLATLCGKMPLIVRTLLARAGFSPASVVALMESKNQLLSIGASFLLSQLLTNKEAKMDSVISRPLALLQLAHGKFVEFSSSVIPVPSPPQVGKASIAPSSAGGAGSPGNTPTTPICLLEGTGLGYSFLGALDGYLQVIQSLMYYLALNQQQSQKGGGAASNSLISIDKPSVQESLSFLRSPLWATVLQRFDRLRAYKPIPSGSELTQEQREIAGELSINGWMSLLTVALDVFKYTLKASASTGEAPSSSTLDTLFLGLCTLLSPLRLGALYAWTDACGGGASGVGLVMKRVLNILYIPFTTPAPTVSDPAIPAAASSDGAMLARVQKLLFNESLVRRLLVGLDSSSACRLGDADLQYQPFIRGWSPSFAAALWRVTFIG